MVKFYKNIISYVIYCLVMFSVMILSITGEILQNTISYVIYFSDDFIDDFIHHWLNFAKILLLMLFIV